MKMIVHDLKSPLTGILGTIEMALDGDLGEISANLSRLLRDGQERGAEALQLMDDLLELTRLEESRVALNLDPFDPSALVSSIVEEWSVRVEQQRATIRGISQVEGIAVADEHLLRRVFANLIGNSLRHAGEEISIVVSVEPHGEEGLKFTVRDDGIGIAPAHHDMIFQKFGSVKGNADSSGTGLGLTFCKLAVEAHDGRIWVDSSERGGTAFCFVIPRAVAEKPAPATADA